MKKRAVNGKSIFQKYREEAGLTRSEVAGLSGEYFNESRLEKVESGKLEIRPEEVVKMAEIYKSMELCSEFCANYCAIGKKRGFSSIKSKDLSQIVLSMLASLNYLNKEKDRLIEITVDGKIDDSELIDFARFKIQLNEIANAVESLSLWVNQMSELKKIDEEKLEEIIIREKANL